MYDPQNINEVPIVFCRKMLLQSIIVEYLLIQLYNLHNNLRHLIELTEIILLLAFSQKHVWCNKDVHTKRY